MSTDTIRSIIKSISDKRTDLSVVTSIIPAGKPQGECELWDFKLLIKDHADSLLELCRDVISFYNSYGGYILFGISDSLDIEGLEAFPFSAKQIKQKAYSFSACDIEVQVEQVEYESKKIFILLIPKRPTGIAVAVMRKDAQSSTGKSIFKMGSVYFRSHESCQLIRSSDDLKFLNTPRHHPTEGLSSSSSLSHNLPDRSMICEKFVGRSDVKKSLWLWLSDEMLRYRVLAGPGGVGKTSAAFSFAEDIVSSAPLGLTQLVWLSAKTKQFNARENRHINLPYSGTSHDSFSNIPSLLDAMLEHMPTSAEERDSMESEPNEAKIAYLQRALQTIPTFFVIDDLDSLEIDDQRRVIEIAMLVGNRQTRFLFTTRKNYLASATSLQQLPGLSENDFADYVKVLEIRYSRQVPKNEMKRFERETGGSPLFTESVFRLLKLGAKFHEALERWKGEDGESVRSAAFSKEIEKLSTNDRRVLYAITLFESCSLAEVRETTELEAPQVEASIIELEQLFLLSSEQIGDEARFSAPSMMSKLLHEQREKLVVGHREIDRRSSILRERARTFSKGRGKDKFIGRFINQAMALLGEDVNAALATVDAGIAAAPTNPDLWMVKARCLLQAPKIDVEAIRKAFLQSFELGKRERALFEKWLEFEIHKGNSNAAIDVISKADKSLVPTPWEWNQMSAMAYMKRGRERLGRFESSDAASDFVQAQLRIEKAAKFAPLAARQSVVSTQSVIGGLLSSCNIRPSH